MLLCPFSRPGLLVFSIDFPEGGFIDVSRKCFVIYDTGSVVVQGKVVAEAKQGKLNGSEINETTPWKVCAEDRIPGLEKGIHCCVVIQCTQQCISFSSPGVLS